MVRKPAAPPPAPEPVDTRPPQFPLSGLLGVMGVAAVVMAPLFYFYRGAQGDSTAKLVGMLMILAGPLLLVVLVSSGASLLRWINRR